MSEEEYGNAIQVHAALEAPGGGTVADKATSMWFLLKDVSSEPGICINYPQKPKFIQESDLKFRQDHNVGPQVSVGGVPMAKWRTDTSAALEYEDMPGRAKITQGKAYVSAFDWGAFGILEVHAYLESGRKVYGALRSEPGRTRIRIPKSQDGSRIADGWKEKTNATGADDADDDAEPEGDARYKGDGLTLYEEYRGWHEDGVRQADEFDGGGDPNRKELFLHDASGMDNKLSLHVFGEATRLRLIWKLRESELSAGQVINFNHREAPHKVDQHAVKIVTACPFQRISPSVGWSAP
jgi:hypothetical protein